jgi:bifunctional non-homologous end joining protein LigD
MIKNKLVLGRYSVVLSNPNKIFFPKTGITKGELIEYYARIAPIMIPFTRERALTMHRFPDGIYGESFFQKDMSDYFPAWIDRVAVPKKDGTMTTYVVCNKQATLVYLANQACITPHLWLSRKDKLDFPDRLIFDLDPPETGASHKNFALVIETALAIKALLHHLMLPSWLMTTGSRGLHVVVPLDRKASFEEVRSFARVIAQWLEQRHPAITVSANKEQRKQKLLIDIQRNGFGATAVAPYAVRAKEGAPVATPIAWERLKDPTLTSQSYTMKNLFEHLAESRKAWETMPARGFSLQKRYKLLKQL